MSIVHRASNVPETSRRGRPWLPSSSNVVLAGLFVFVCVFSVAPIARLMLEGLVSGGALDLARITRIFSQQSVWTATVNTLVMALFATAFAAVLGGTMATVITVTDLRWKPALIFCFILPLMIPPQVATLAWINFFGPSNPLLQALGLHRQALHPLYSMQGMIFVLGLHNAPLVFIALRASLRAVPTDLVEAARIEGGTPLRVLATIVAPLSMSGAIAGCALAFVSIAGNFAIPAMLGIPGRVPTLITVIYQKLSDYGQDALGDVAVLALVLAVIAIAGLVCQGWLLRRRDLRVLNLSSRPICFELGRWRLVAELACWVVVFLVLVLPLSALLSAALVTGYGQPLNADTATLANFSNALFRHTMVRNAFITSFWISLSTAVILTVITAPMAYFTVWRPNWLVRAQNVMVEIGYALPGTVVGIAAILLFVKPLPIVGVSLYGTPWIILAAYLMNRIVLSLRPTISGFVQLDKSLEEAAQVVGAGFLRRMVDIILPLIAPAAFAGASLVFLTALTEIQVSVMLVTSRTQTIGAAIYFLSESGATTLASAVGILIILIVLSLMLFVSAFQRWLPKGALPWSA